MHKLKAILSGNLRPTHDTTLQILTAELRNISDDATVHLPIVGNLRRTIRSQRQTRNHYPIPASREEIPKIPNEFRFLENGEEFLQYDSGADDVNRILIFGTYQNLQLLNNSEQWFVDGTFKVCPTLFFQLYTVHAQNNGRILPCIFRLLPNKFQTTYTEFFVQVRNLAILHGDGPNAILFDFGQATINAASEEFPQADMKGCFFHLSSN